MKRYINILVLLAIIGAVMLSGCATQSGEGTQNNEEIKIAVKEKPITEQPEASASTSGTEVVEKFTKADAARKYTLSEAQLVSAPTGFGNTFTLDELTMNGFGKAMFYDVNNFPEISGRGGLFFTDIKYKSSPKMDTVEFYVLNLQKNPTDYRAGQRIILENGMESKLNSQVVTIPSRTMIKVTATPYYMKEGGEQLSNIAKIKF